MMESFPQPGEKKKGIPFSEKAAVHEYFRRQEAVNNGRSRETSSQRSADSEAYRTGFDEYYFEEDGVKKEEKMVTSTDKWKPLEDLGAVGIDGNPLEDGADPFAAIDARLDNLNPKEDPEVTETEPELKEVQDGEVDLETELEERYGDAMRRFEEESGVDSYAASQRGGTRQTMISHVEDKEGTGRLLHEMGESHNSTPRRKTPEGVRINEKLGVSEREMLDKERLGLKGRTSGIDPESEKHMPDEDRAALEEAMLNKQEAA